MNKRKIINDPVHGFITIPNELIFDITEHPYFQRLRRIKQLGLTDYVYPGAVHTRFNHALGAMHLMQKAVTVLRRKGHEITVEEENGVLIAILLHDIGHGPFSHTLEKTFTKGISHEEISLLFMQRLNGLFDGRLEMAISIFKDEYSKKFLHQLVSSQLDMDRLDYLARDSFFTGVSEGIIGYDRIINMLEVKNDQLVVESKAIYSIEKFLISRRIMYWQVYLHKAVWSVEEMLIKIFDRAKHLLTNGAEISSGSEELDYFLTNNPTNQDFKNNLEILDLFSKVDDYDTLNAVKRWQKSEDVVLNTLCTMLINRNLLKVELSDEEPQQNKVSELISKAQAHYNISEEDAQYFVIPTSTTIRAYNPNAEHIQVLYKDGSLENIEKASDNLDIPALSKSVKKHFLLYPKVILG